MSSEISNPVSKGKIFRFKFSQNFLPFLEEFARLHRYDDPKMFKERWKYWIEEHKDLINREKNSLEIEGYEGNVLIKMFKSARYYFKNKSTEKVAAKKRRKYIGLERDLLDAIDEHVVEVALKEELKPARALINFLETDKYKPIIKRETIRLKSYKLDILDINKKIKKTYKNRHFNKSKKN